MPQPVPVNTRQPKLLTGRLELSIDEIVAVESVPLSVPNTKVSGFTPTGLRAERISMHFAPRGTDAPTALTLGLIENTLVNRDVSATPQFVER
jgi:hypothetical protein